jgi:primosomal protein N' (replication factor Y)
MASRAVQEADEDASATLVVDVLAPVAVDVAYSYRAPPGLALAPGDVVDVPLGSRETTGVVWETRRSAAGGNLKSVIGKRDLPALRAPLRDFIDWVARWTLSPRGMTLRMAIRAPDGAGPEPVRFGVRPAEWHSGVTPRRRARAWAAVASGEAKVVAGARSALFLPFKDLGLVVVDEEHEGAYKQEDGVAYNARDMAVVRARLEGAACVLASATPSIESRVNAQQGRYGHLRLASRFGGRRLPHLAAIDMTRNAAPRGRWISPPLQAAMAETLERGEQSLLFLNRRGYAPLTLCRACGHRFQCPECTAWLVEHRFRRALVCHHCGHVERRPDACPECETVDSLTACGPGVERLAEEAVQAFPQARVLTLSSDFPGGTERLKRELEEVARGAFDIVIGTQLVAKGHNFPGMTLVGVVDADVGLASGDPRAAERTFQMLQQVTGRAGRGDRPGSGLVQTYQPAHPVMRALVSGDAERFYAEEIEQRLRAGLPPFGRLAALVVSGKDRASAEGHARALVRAAHGLPPAERWRLTRAGALPEDGDLTLLGPAEAPIAVVRGRHRFRLLVRAPRTADLQGFLRAMLAAAPPERGGVRVDVDVDPMSFL